MTRAAVAVVNYDGGDDLLDCLRSVHAQSCPPAELLLVDNGSADGSADRAEAAFPGLRRLDLPHNPGYGGAANAALASTEAELLVVLNPDVVLELSWLETIAAAFRDDPRLGVAGGKLLYPDGTTIQHAGGFLHRPLMLADHYRYREPDDPAEQEPADVEYVTGAALAIRRSTADALGGFDEGFFLYYEETDLCRRARDAGWRVLYLPAARAVHRESAVTVRHSAAYYRLFHHGRVRFALKHLTPAEFLCQFVPAERARIGNVVSLEELAGLRHAFADHAALLAGADGAGLANAQPELRPALADALADLSQRALTTTPSALRASNGHGAARELAARARVEPRPFRSAALVVGPAVARFRTIWNWVSTRWYLAPILEQQNAFNREVAESIARLEARLAALESRADLPPAWLAELDRDLTALARRVTARERPS